MSSLRSADVEWDPEDEAELLAGIEAGADRLDHLINNLLDMSRLQTGTVTPLIQETDLDEVVPYALGGVPPEAVRLEVPETLPMIRADAGLLERSLANLVENAVKYSPDGVRVLVKADALEQPGRPGRVELRIVDRGPGVPEDAKERIFAPFQRYGDAPRGAGVGLGLAVARGFVEAMDGSRVEMGPGESSFGEDQNPRERDGRKGHLSGTVGDEPAVLMIVQFDSPPTIGAACRFR